MKDLRGKISQAIHDSNGKYWELTTGEVQLDQTDEESSINSKVHEELIDEIISIFQKE